MGMKYIVLQIKNGETVLEWPIIFPDMMVHSDVANVIQKHLYLQNQDSRVRVISAGSVSFFGGEVRCSGESETLDIESRGDEDARLIKMFDYLHGIV